MGGIVTRDYLLKNRDIAAKTAFAYFFATPTTGSEAASVLRWVLNNPQIEDLKSMNPGDCLANLADQWLHANFSFPSYCGYETRPTDGKILVGLGNAALLCTRGLDPIDADHVGIVKPEDQNSPSYMAFKSAGISRCSRKSLQRTPDTPPIGSLHFITAALELDHSKQSDQWAGQVKVEIENATDKLIFFRAITAGNINGMAFADNKVIFEGYIEPRERTTLFSNRIIGFNVDLKAGFSKPSALAIYEYDLAYRFADEKEFSRESARGLRIEYRQPIPETSSYWFCNSRGDHLLLLSTIGEMIVNTH